MNFTKKEKEVLFDICNGADLITDNSEKGAWISFLTKDKKEEYHIHNGVFFNLLNKNAIYQDMNRGFHYYPTGEIIEKFKVKK